MKSLFIFITYLYFFVGGCASTNQQIQEEDSLFISGSYQQWYATAPGETEFSEKGIDLQLELHQNNEIHRPVYIIFNGRKSFPAEVNLSGEDEEKLVIKARIILETSLFSETSGRSDESDRLVYSDEDGEFQYIEISSWERLPDRYD